MVPEKRDRFGNTVYMFPSVIKNLNSCLSEKSLSTADKNELIKCLNKLNASFKPLNSGTQTDENFHKNKTNTQLEAINNLKNFFENKYDFK